MRLTFWGWLGRMAGFRIRRLAVAMTLAVPLATLAAASPAQASKATQEEIKEELRPVPRLPCGIGGRLHHRDDDKR